MPEEATVSSSGTAPEVVDTGDYISELYGSKETSEPIRPATRQEVQAEPESTVDEEQQQQADTAEEPADKADDWREQRINELAKQKGLDAADPTIRKLLMEIATIEKRNRDQEAFHNQKWDEIFSDVDKVFAEAVPETQPVKQDQRQQQPQQQVAHDPKWQPQPFNFDDGFNFQTPVQALEEWAKAWGDDQTAPDYNRLHQLQVAKLRRDFHRWILPDILSNPELHGLIDGSLGEFKKRELDGIAKHVNGQTQQQQATDALHTAQQRLKNLPNVKPIFEEMLKVDHQKPTFHVKEKNGSTTEVANNPFNRIMAEMPELLEDIDTTLPPAKLIRQYGKIYSVAMRQYVNQRKSALTPQKAGEILAQGAEQQKRTTEEQRVRANINRGATASGSVPTDSDDYISELRSTTGGVPTLAEIQRQSRRQRAR